MSLRHVKIKSGQFYTETEPPYGPILTNATPVRSHEIRQSQHTVNTIVITSANTVSNVVAINKKPVLNQFDNLVRLHE